MRYYIFSYQPKTVETKVLSRSTVSNITEEELWDPKVKADMEALDPSIKSCWGKAYIEENDEYEGLFIEETMIYEYLADPDPTNTEPIGKEALMTDVEALESTDAYDQ